MQLLARNFTPKAMITLLLLLNCLQTFGAERDACASSLKLQNRASALDSDETISFEPHRELVHALDLAGQKLVSIPEVWHVELLRVHELQLSRENKKPERFFKSDDNKPSAAERLAKRYEAGDEAAHTLTLLGYHLVRQANGQTALVQDRSWDGFIRRYMSSLALKIANRQIPRDKAIWPAFIFAKKTASEKDLKTDPNVTLWVRPFLDEWPSPDEYRMLSDSEGQLSHEIFAAGAARGMYPFIPGDFADHEIGHFSEFFSDPNLMVAFAADIQKSHFTVEADASPEVVKAKKDRHFALNEFMSLPNISKVKELSALVQHFSRFKGLDILKEDVAFLELLPADEQRSHSFKLAQALSENESLIIRMGGGTRDSYNLQEELRDARFRVGAELFRSYKTVLADAYLENIHRKGLRRVALDNLHGTLEEIKLIYTIRYEPEKLVNFISESRLREDFLSDIETRNHKLDQMLIYRIATLETAIANSLKLKVSPAVLIGDSGSLKLSRNSATYRYFASFLSPNSYLWSIFCAPNVID